MIVCELPKNLPLRLDASPHRRRHYQLSSSVVGAVVAMVVPFVFMEVLCFMNGRQGW